VPLTAGRSLAVDKRIHVYGTPIWLEADLPIENEKARNPVSALAVCAGYGLRDRRSRAGRYLLWPRRGDQSHCRPNQAERTICDARPAERGDRRDRGENPASKITTRDDSHSGGSIRYRNDRDRTGADAQASAMRP
jgi:hypothetical protein